jgi:hypothetical protein
MALLVIHALIPGCVGPVISPSASAVFEGLKDLHLSGHRGWWSVGMTPGSGGEGKFYMDYDRREAGGSGISPLPDGGRVIWKIEGMEVRTARGEGREAFAHHIVLRGRFEISAPKVGVTHEQARVYVTHFDSSPPWMAVRVLSQTGRSGTRYAESAATLYFHASAGG